MKRIQCENLTQISVSGPEGEGIGGEEEEMKDSVDQDLETMNQNSAFNFNILCLPIETQESMSKLPITPTKILRDSKFLKRLINDLLFPSELLERKNLGTLRIDESFI